MATELTVQSERAFQVRLYMGAIARPEQHSLTAGTETTTHLPQLQGKGWQVDARRKGRQEMVQGCRFGLQDT
jgi:hypothetical protein